MHRFNTSGRVMAAMTIGICAIGFASPAMAAEEGATDGATAIEARGFDGFEAEDGVPAGSGEVSMLAGNCGVRVDLPHPSGTTANQIHTRVESFCRVQPVQANTLRAVGYRSRWFGWENMRTKADGPKPKDLIRITVDINCDNGSEHRWRTEGRGVAVISGRTHTASAYEQNDDEIRCGANN